MTAEQIVEQSRKDLVNDMEQYFTEAKDFFHRKEYKTEYGQKSCTCCRAINYTKNTFCNYCGVKI